VANAKPVQNGLALILKGEYMYSLHFISSSQSFIQDQSGVTAVEYGLIAALIAAAILIGIGSLGTAIGTLFSNLAICFNTGNCIF
jgi:pilus assembly protein Flp/PilA